MAKKKFVLRIEESTMKAVEKWAADEFRSVNGQLEWMITKSLRDARRLRPSIQKKEKEEGKNPGDKEN
ncbi:MAG: Arc family DNA binding domain-containing protein [Bacteroidota bacterium]